MMSTMTINDDDNDVDGVCDYVVDVIVMMFKMETIKKAMVIMTRSL